jgi:hypothetical protein
VEVTESKTEDSVVSKETGWITVYVAGAWIGLGDLVEAMTHTSNLCCFALACSPHDHSQVSAVRATEQERKPYIKKQKAHRQLEVGEDVVPQLMRQSFHGMVNCL